MLVILSLEPCSADQGLRSNFEMGGGGGGGHR